MQTLQENTILQGGKYTIISILGQGGFGITYLGVQSGLDRKVAIKEFFIREMCKRDDSTNHVTLGTEGSRETVDMYRQKFLKEARSIAQLNHPNIVRIIDVFEENGTAYYVMEYAEGGSLKDKVKENGSLSEAVATRYIIQVAEALDYIHQRNMNHLDVKPGNIMLNEKDETLLIDFGLSKQYDASSGSQTSSTPVGISEGYAPMEQYKKGGVSVFSPETDIYALGATFFNLLTGLTPPSASDVYEDGIPVKELESKGVSRKAISVICQAMAGRKKDRLKSAQAFINALSKSNKAKTKTNVKDENTTVVAVHEKHGIKKSKMWIGIGVMAVAVIVISLELMSGYNDNYITVDEGKHDITEGDEKHEQLQQKTITVNGVSFDMIWVEAGTFTMGRVDTTFSNNSELAHKVTLTKNYYIGKTEVTQTLWVAVMGGDPSWFDASKPVSSVSWDDCELFLSKLNTLTDLNFRLPTEAEWEYAARGGNRSCNYRYSGSNDIDEVAWYKGNSNYTVHAVATKKPNELGVYDMSGNVAEWCSDWYDKNYYKYSPQIDPIGPDNGKIRVKRGGDCIDTYELMSRGHYKYNGNSEDWYYRMLRDLHTGLRLVLDE